MNLEILCCKEPSRSRIQTVFRAYGGRWLVATNGKALAAVLDDGSGAEIRTIADGIMPDAVSLDATPCNASSLADVCGEVEMEHEETCPICDGKTGGKQECEKCLGNGEHSCSCGTDHECGYCGGTGETSCAECEGTGKIIVPPKVRTLSIRGLPFDKNLLALMFKALPELRQADRMHVDGRLELYGEKVRGLAMPLYETKADELWIEASK